jgi:hypothetical protein
VVVGLPCEAASGEREQRIEGGGMRQLTPNARLWKARVEIIHKWYEHATSTKKRKRRKWP